MCAVPERALLGTALVLCVMHGMPAGAFIVI